MLKLRVVTPDKVVIDEIVDNVSIPTTTGMITVLNRHTSLVSTIKAGEMTIRKGGTGVGHSVYRGVVNVRPHQKGLTEVVVLLERAEVAEELDHARAEQALARAKEMFDETEDELEFGRYEGMIEKELNRVKVAMKYRRH